jgi:uncharacterized protein YwbE
LTTVTACKTIYDVTQWMANSSSCNWYLISFITCYALFCFRFNVLPTVVPMCCNEDERVQSKEHKQEVQSVVEDVCCTPSTLKRLWHVHPPGIKRKLTLYNVHPPGIKRKLTLCNVHPPGIKRKLTLCNVHPPGIRRKLTLCNVHPPGIKRKLTLCNVHPPGTKRKLTLMYIHQG